MSAVSLIIDLVFIAVLVIFFFKGRKDGFVKMLLSLFATGISCIVASEYSPAVAQWANERFIRENAVESIAEKIAKVIDGGTNSVLNALPSYVISAAEKAGISIESLVADASSSADPAAIAESIYGAVEGIIVAVLQILAFILVFVIAHLILSIGVKIISTFFKLPVLKQFNEMLGGIAGVIKGVFAVVVLCTGLHGVSVFTSGSELSQGIDGSLVQQFVWNIIDSISNV